ncbi:MAG: stage III sporulation protein AC [Clostridia bacterium]|nr:stage III sporulation protein AC [Clostridia bacterium]
MDIGLIMKIAGVGILVAVINQVLSKSGRDEHVMFVTLAGVVVVLLMLVKEISALFETVRGVFGL